MKKLKNQNKAKKNGGSADKAGDAKSDGGDDFDEEDDCDSDDLDARSGCSSPRSLTPPPGDRTPAAGNSEKPAKKGWFSFSSAPPKDKKSQVPVEPPVEVAKEAESDLPIADQLLGTAARPMYRIDFQVQVSFSYVFLWTVTGNVQKGAKKL